MKASTNPADGTTSMSNTVIKSVTAEFIRLNIQISNVSGNERVLSLDF